jgi:hypothetical protein
MIKHPYIFSIVFMSLISFSGLKSHAAGHPIREELMPEMCLPQQKELLAWQESTGTLALMNEDQIVWKFNFSKAEGKPYFHPLSTLDGQVLTELRPVDHPWHRGIWFAWKFLNGLNYWEEDLKTGRSEGCTEIKSVKTHKAKNFEANIELILGYHPENQPDILDEKRIIHVSAPRSDGSYHIDWESTFTVLADEVLFDRTPLPNEPDGKSWGGYAGFSARLNNQFQEVDARNEKWETNIATGNQSRWMTFEMKNKESELASVTIFDHPENVNFPNKWYISIRPDTPFYYFSPSILYDSKMTLKKGEKLNLKYRLLVSPGKPEATIIQLNWNEFQHK